MKIRSLLFGILLVTALLFSLGYSSAAEEDDRLYGISKYLILYYNPKSITRPSKDTVRLRIKVVSKCNDSKDWTIKSHPNCSNIDWDYVVTLTEINCLSKQDRDIESVGYNKEGDSTESSVIETPWSDIVPESYTDFLYGLVCN
jgi:hypothetical protein